MACSASRSTPIVISGGLLVSPAVGAGASVVPNQMSVPLMWYCTWRSALKFKPGKLSSECHCKTLF